MNIRVMGSKAGEVSLNSTESHMFKLIQTRKGTYGDVHHCMYCSKQIPTGSYCFGSKDIKYCYRCGKQVMANFKKSLINLSEDIDKLVEDIDELQVDKNNAVANLSYEPKEVQTR